MLSQLPLWGDVPQTRVCDCGRLCHSEEIVTGPEGTEKGKLSLSLLEAGGQLHNGSVLGGEDSKKDIEREQEHWRRRTDDQE